VGLKIAVDFEVPGQQPADQWHRQGLDIILMLEWKLDGNWG
jgi:hypothetical protein